MIAFRILEIVPDIILNHVNSKLVLHNYTYFQR